MPVHTFEHLIHSQALRDIVDRLPAVPPGLVLSTGGIGTGKVTTLMALADRLARPDRDVILVADDEANVAPFLPLPDRWRSVLVEPDEGAWRAALGAGTTPDGAIVVVTPLRAINAGAVLATATGRWLLASVDTDAVGLDVAAGLQQLGMSRDAFADRVRLVWSQQLAAALCTACSAPAQVTATEAAAWFADGPPGAGIRMEVGCPVCQATPNQAQGTKGRAAICDAILIDGESRQAVRNALLEGIPLQPAPPWHVAAKDEARALLTQGALGIGTYRDLIRRNPRMRSGAATVDR
jgi:Type II/IV secretion system protein